MSKGAETRARMIETASRLFQAQGYAATGLNQILTESGTPRGSMYFHFPQGKAGLAAAVVEAHAAEFAAALEAVVAATPTTADAVEAAIGWLAGQIETTACRAGCPVTVVALEVANDDPDLRAATRRAYERWAAPLAERLRADGHPAPAAASLARGAVAALEGALVMCRAFGDAGPLRDVAATLRPLLTPPDR